MYAFLLVLFVFVALLMAISILMQASKGGGLAASFGGMGAGGVFGPRDAANFLQKATTVLAILYGVICLIIGLIGRPTAVESGSVIQRQMQQETTVPALPVVPFQTDDETQMPPPQLPAEEQQEQSEPSPGEQ